MKSTVVTRLVVSGLMVLVAQTSKAQVPAQLVDVKELVKANQYMVTLEFSKTTITLDPIDLVFSAIANEMAKKEETFEVGQLTYNNYRVGQELSSKSDILGFILSDDGAFDTYNVTVKNKNTITRYARVSKNNASVEIDGNQYNQLRGLVQTHLSSKVATSSYNGVERLVILDHPLQELNVASVTQLKRYYVNLEISNSTYTLDIFKHARNALLSHDIEIEVTSQQYNKPNNRMWEPHFGYSFFVTGRLSQMEGTATKRWAVNDPQYVEVLLDDGTKLVMTQVQAKQITN